MTTTCNKCGRTLRAPVYVGGVPFGSTCAQAFAGVRAPRGTSKRRRRAVPAVQATAQADQRDLFAEDLAYAQRVESVLSTISLEMT